MVSGSVSRHIRARIIAYRNEGLPIVPSDRTEPTSLHHEARGHTPGTRRRASESTRTCGEPTRPRRREPSWATKPRRTTATALF
eukprot:741892-Prorocentrum_minimum.AAC.6